MAAEQVAGQRSSEIGQNVAKARVSSWNYKKLERFDKARAKQRKSNCSPKTESVQPETCADWDKEKDVQEQIDGGSFSTLQTPEGDLFGAPRWSEGDNGDSNQARQ